jgi:hypothetical protein
MKRLLTRNKKWVIIFLKRGSTMQILRVFSLICIMQFVLLSPSYGIGAELSLMPPSVQPLPPQNQHLWELFNVGSDEDLTALLLQDLETKGIGQVILELNAKLTMSDMKKLYSILIGEASTEPLALRLWEFTEQKEKIESVPLYGDPRVILIAKSKQVPFEFWIGLSDGSFWQVEPYHMGGDDPFLQKIMINALLGNYIMKADPALFEVRQFPKGEFAGLLNVKEMEQGVNLEGKDVYFLAHDGFMK